MTTTRPPTDDEMATMASDSHERAKRRNARQESVWRAVSNYCTLVGNFVRDDKAARRMHELARDALDRANAIASEASKRKARR